MNRINLTMSALALLVIVASCQSAPAIPKYDGASLYANNCSNCHGVYGEGNGALTPSLSVVLKDLRYLALHNEDSYPTEFVRKIIDGRETRAAHGPEGMPMWGNVFARQEGTDQAAQARVTAKIESLVEFLGSIQKED